MKKLFFASLFLFAAHTLSAQMVSNPVTWKSSVKKVADKTYEVTLTADIEDGWHMYSQSTPAGGPIPTKVTFSNNPLVTMDGAIKEKGKLEERFEPLFGVDVKQFSNQVVFSQIVKTKTKVNTSLEVAVQFMVCDDHQCLPPTTKKMTVALK